MKSGKTLQQFAAEIQRQAETKQDYVTPIGMIELATVREGDDAASKTRVGLQDIGSYGVDINAHRQIGSYLGIPADFYDTLRGNLELRDPYNQNVPLFDAMVNGLLASRPRDDRRLVRTLDGNVRAFLSDKYRPIDHDEIFTRMMPVLSDIPGLSLEHSSMELTGNRLYMQVVSTDRPKVVPGTHDRMDAFFRGAVITNSEVGLGSFAVQPLVFHQICSNGMIITKFGKRKYHTGGTGSSGEAGDVWQYFQNDTVQARNAATILEMRDMLGRCLADDFFDKVTDDITQAQGLKIAPTKAEAAIENVTQRFRLTHEERAGVLGRFIEGGNLTVWGVIEALTRHAQDVDSYDRSVELQAQAGTILALPKHEIKALTEGEKN